MAILRLPAVRARTGLSRATIYRKIQGSEFPRPHQLSQRAVEWLECDVEAWVTSLEVPMTVEIGGILGGIDYPRYKKYPIISVGYVDRIVSLRLRHLS